MGHPLRSLGVPSLAYDMKGPDRSVSSADFVERAQDVLRSAGFAARICSLHPASPLGNRSVAVSVRAGDVRIRWMTGASAALVPCALNYRAGARSGEFVLFSGLTVAEVDGFIYALLDRSVQNSFPEIDLGPWDPHQPDQSLRAELDAHFEVLRSMHARAFQIP